MRTRTLLFITAALAVGLPVHGGQGTGKGPCETSDDCDGGVCVAVNGQAYCSRSCGACPAGTYCDAKLFSAVGLKVCLRGTAERPVAPRAAPSLPCSTDEGCPGALICASGHGHKSCTLPCTSDGQCRGPVVAGLKASLLTCQPDAAQPRRGACLVNPDCISNPLACMSVAHTRLDVGVPGFGVRVDVRTGGDPTAGAMSDETPDPFADEHVAAAPAAPAVAMPEARFRRLLKQLGGASFTDARTQMLEMAAKRNRFTCRQLGRIVAKLTFAEERVGAVGLLRPRLVDLENAHEVLERFTFAEARAEAARILADD